MPTYRHEYSPFLTVGQGKEGLKFPLTVISAETREIKTKDGRVLVAREVKLFNSPDVKQPDGIYTVASAADKELGRIIKEYMVSGESGVLANLGKPVDKKYFRFEWIVGEGQNKLEEGRKA